MVGKDYYKLLGVEKKATGDDIKKAYRKLAMKYHPDHAKGEKGAEDKFKEISEAYAVLSDSEKRKEYDTFGTEGFGRKYAQEDIFNNVDLDSILRGFGFGGSGGSFSFKTSGSRGRSAQGSPFGSAYSTGGNDFFGFGGSQPGFGTQQVSKGQDLLYEMSLTPQEIYNGTEKEITLQGENSVQRIKVKIPKGFTTGKKLRIAKKGNPSPYGGESGDLLIQSKVVSTKDMSAKNQDLTIVQEIKLSEALLGTKATVHLPDGTTSTLKIPEGTRHRTQFKMAGRGIPGMKKNEKPGDLYVQVRVKLPKTLSDEQKKLVKGLQSAGL